MPIKFGSNEKITSGIDNYVVEEVLSQGAFAHAARARSSSRGKLVFLKRYFEPTAVASWYQGFVDHQQELKRRITNHEGLRQYCYGFIDFFEGTEGRSKRTFHQVFEFIDGGKPLSKFIGEISESEPSASWNERVTYSRIMMMAISALHEQRIVHTDLKPDNLLLIPNPHRPGAFSLKVIDMDWSIFSDRLAPWHGKNSYIGTPGYMSPEHLTQAIPTEASDVFTCAIMLSELLCGYHPFTGKLGDAATFLNAIKAEDFKSFSLPLPIDKVSNPSYLEDMLHRALDFSADRRPSASQLKDALFGRGAAGETPPPRHIPSPVPPLRPNPLPSESSKALSSTVGVELSLEGSPVLKIRIDTTVGRQMLKPFSIDAQFMEDQQFKIHRVGGGCWMVSPLPKTSNETIVDGIKLISPMALSDGMKIAVGNSSKGIEKMPLIVRLI
jgi:serine/threonine protein kinase